MERPKSTRFTLPDDEVELSAQLGTLFGPQDEGVSEALVVAKGLQAIGRAEVHLVRPGMQLFVLDMAFGRDVQVDIHPVSPGFFTSIVLAGKSCYSVKRLAGRHEPWEFLPGRNIVGTFNAEKSGWQIAGGHTHQLVELQITSGRARQMFSEDSGTGDGPVHPILAGREGFATHVEPGLSSDLKMIGHQIISCPLEGSSRRLYMESKALEILALQMDALAPSKLSPQHMSKDDRDRLEEARRIVEQEFVDPPSLLALARRVGLNDFKLKRGFRQLYRTTVFGYVRTLRMERARMMLAAGESTVSEAALAAGYSCFGHFAKVFRQHFGIMPRDLKKRQST